MPRVLIPPVPGNSCAMGLLMTNFQEDTAVAYLSSAAEADVDEINRRLETLRGDTIERLRSQGVADGDVTLSHIADIRYRGQVHELRIEFGEYPVTDATLRAMVARFEDTYEDVYTIRLAEGVPELVSLRVTAVGTLPQYAPDRSSGGGDPTPKGRRDVLEEDGYGPVDVYDRYSLAAGTRLDGPVILEEAGSTIWVATGMACEVDDVGNLIIHTNVAAETAPPAGVASASA
jgi:N-methylhydantoinase A